MLLQLTKWHLYQVSLQPFEHNCYVCCVSLDGQIAAIVIGSVVLILIVLAAVVAVILLLYFRPCK